VGKKKDGQEGREGQEGRKGGGQEGREGSARGRTRRRRKPGGAGPPSDSERGGTPRAVENVRERPRRERGRGNAGTASAELKAIVEALIFASPDPLRRSRSTKLLRLGPKKTSRRRSPS